MRLPALLTLLVGCWLVAGCQHGPPLSKEQEQRYGEMLRSGKVKTEFDRGAVLAPWQQEEVLALADQCGLRDPAWIRTYSVIGGIGWVRILVDGRDQIEGRSRRVNQVEVFRAGWNREYESRSTNVQKVGRFWALGNCKETLHFRTYDFWDDPAEIRIGDEVDVGLADRVIALIAKKDVDFPGKNRSVEKRYLDLAEAGVRPVSLEKRRSDGSFTLYFQGFDSPDRSLHFHFDGNVVVIDGIGMISY